MSEKTSLLVLHRSYIQWLTRPCQSNPKSSLPYVCSLTTVIKTYTASVVAVHEYPLETIYSLCNFKRPRFQGEVTSYTWLPTEIILNNILIWEKKLPESLVDALVNNQPMYNFCQPLWIYSGVLNIKKRL